MDEKRHKSSGLMDETLFVHPPTVAAMRDVLGTDWNVTLGANGDASTARTAAADPGALIDFSLMNGIFENFLEVVGLPIAIIDLEGRVLASSRWQRLCVDFHRTQDGTLARCLESDTRLSRDMLEGKNYSMYRCRNGLTDCATPIIVEDIHVANLFIGQFLLAPPDLDYFRQQQEEFGFDKDAYFKALSEVPIVSEQKLPAILKLMGGFAQQIARQSLAERRVRASYAVVERQVAERTRELRDRERDLSEAQHIAHLGIWVMDLTSSRLTWSEEMHSIFGIRPDEFDGTYQTFIASLHPDDRESVGRAYKESLNEGGHYDIEYRIRRRSDGSLRWGHARCEHQRDAAGRVLRSLGTVLDITERKRAEEALRKASLYARSLIEASLDPLVTISPAGTITDVNQATETVTGRSRDDLIGSDFCSYFVEPDEALLGYRKVFSEGRVTDYPLAIRHVSGHVTDVLYNATVYRDETGEVEGVFAAARDVTDRKRAEEALAQASRQLASSNAELQQFAHTASHDLQEPLRMVTSYLGLLERRYGAAFDDEGHEFLHFAIDGAKRMSVLIRDLLEYARIDGRCGELVAVETASVLDEAQANLSTAIAEADGKIVIDGALPTVLGDRGQLVRLFQNLIGNAIKYRDPARPPLIRIGASRKGAGWMFSVEDNGIGIASEHFDKIFMIFQRLHGRGEYEGTGVGLAIAKRVVERHGGRVWLQSQPGKGSTFFFTLKGAAATT